MNPAQLTSCRIINADYDEETFTATLDAKVAIWKDIAETFTLDFGKVQLPPMSLQGDVSAAISYDDSVSIDLTQSVRNPVIFQTSSAASGFDLTVSCLDCGTRGTLDVKGHVRVEWFKVTELTVEASPENVEARLHLGVKVQGNSAVSFTKELFSVGLGGFNVCFVVVEVRRSRGSADLDCRFRGSSRWARRSTMRSASARL